MRLERRKLRSRRGVSQTLGTLLLLAIVAAVGTPLLIEGITVLNHFNYAVKTERSNIDIIGETLDIEHVRFTPSSNAITVYVRNTGTVETILDSITILKIDTQEVLIKTDLEQTVFAREIVKLDLTANFVNVNNKWDDNIYSSSKYKITVSTLNGNSFESEAEPFNT